jgi:hypothetical protein
MIKSIKVNNIAYKPLDTPQDIDGYVYLSICKSPLKPDPCKNSSVFSYGYFADYKTFCLPLSSENDPDNKSVWKMTPDINVG